jgi:inner membrane protein
MLYALAAGRAAAGGCYGCCGRTRGALLKRQPATPGIGLGHGHRGSVFLLHMSMDFLNSYGIHPAVPVRIMRWFYGDMIFIVEPVFWVAFGVPLALAIPWKFLR